MTGENVEQNKDHESETDPKENNLPNSGTPKKKKPKPKPKPKKQPSKDPIEEDLQLLEVILQKNLGFSEIVAKNIVILLIKTTHKKDFIAKIQNIPHANSKEKMFSDSAINKILTGAYPISSFNDKLNSILPNIQESTLNFWNQQLEEFKKTKNNSK